jgi:polygalacturonase
MKMIKTMVMAVISAFLLLNTAYAEPKWVSEVGAKTFPKGKKIFKANTYGAKGDSLTLNTKAIQAAIDACAAAGGGVVTFDTGQYVSGSIFLKKNVTLQLDKGVTIVGSNKLADYPDMPSRIAGIEMVWPAALINVIDQDKVAITGEGVVDGRGKPFWDSYWTMRKDYDKRGLRWIVDYDCKRPRTLLISNSTNITVKGITLKRAGFWTVQVLYSQFVTVKGIIIRNNEGGHGPSTDGVDIDSSSDILVEDSDIDCNDDNFCMKAGRDADGLRVNRPCERVVIRNCIARAGGGLFTCGSETSGSIRNIWVENITAYGTKVGIRVKSAITRGGVVENVYVNNVEMKGVIVPIEVTTNWNPTYSYSKLPEGYTYDSIPAHWKVMLQKVEPESKGIPVFRKIYINNLHATGAEKKAISAQGMSNSEVDDFEFSNVSIESATAGELDFCRNWKFTNVQLKTKDGSTLKVTNCEGMKLGDSNK